MREAVRIMNGAASLPAFHGSTTSDVVDEILDVCEGFVLCRGVLREFVFTKITERSFTFKTKGWDNG